MALHYTDGGRTTLNGAISDSDTTITVLDGSVFGTSFPMKLTIWDAGTYTNPMDDPSREVVRATARTDADLTVVRGQDGTSATAHADGSAIACVLVASGMHDLVSKTPDTSADNVVTAQAAAATPLILKGAESQTADLLQCQTSAGTEVVAVSPDGDIEAAGGVGMFGVSLTSQVAVIATCKADYTTGELNTEAEIIAALNATNTAVNALIAALQDMGLVATS